MPYPSGPLAAPVGPNPTYVSNSAAIINNYFSSNPNSLGQLQGYGGAAANDNVNDWSLPL